MRWLALIVAGFLIGLTIGGMLVNNDQNDKIKALEMAVSILTEKSA